MATPAPKPVLTGPNKVLTSAQKLAVELYAGGRSRTTVCEIMLDLLYPEAKYWRKKKRQRAISRVRSKLINWEQRQWFRDALWEATLVSTDLSLPRVMDAVVDAAKGGDIQAARLALEVTNRHNPRGGEQTPAVVNINLSGVARPQSRALPQPADVEIEDADVEELT